MILLILVLLCVLALVGSGVMMGFRFLDFFVFPCGRNPHRPSRWLTLLLVATLLGVIVFLQHQ